MSRMSREQHLSLRREQRHPAADQRHEVLQVSLVPEHGQLQHDLVQVEEVHVLGDVGLALQVHLEVGAEHHQGVHEAGLEDGVVEGEQPVEAPPEAGDVDGAPGDEHVISCESTIR